MANKYDEAMERLTLSEEAKARILKAVTEESAKAAEPEKKGKILSFPAAARWIAAAAAVLVLVFAVTAVLRNGLPGPAEPGPVLQGSIETRADAKALSESVGFEVEDAALLFPDAEETVYEDLFGRIAQIRIESAKRDCVFRKVKGSEDVSGDYTVYEAETTADAAGISVTLKGTEEGYVLALWERDGFSFSLSVDPPMDAEGLTALAAALNAQ